MMDSLLTHIYIYASLGHYALTEEGNNDDDDDVDGDHDDDDDDDGDYNDDYLCFDDEYGDDAMSMTL